MLAPHRIVSRLSLWNIDCLEWAILFLSLGTVWATCCNVCSLIGNFGCCFFFIDVAFLLHFLSCCTSSSFPLSCWILLHFLCLAVFPASFPLFYYIYMFCRGKIPLCSLGWHFFFLRTFRLSYLLYWKTSAWQFMWLWSHGVFLQSLLWLLLIFPRYYCPWNV